MANLIENIDFNGDGAFTGSDLDISWAYLQVKKRYEDEVAANGAMTITEQNFVAEVDKQYKLNQTGTIAEAPTGNPSILPGSISDSAPAPATPVQFKKLWIFNNPNSPDEAIESVSGLVKGTISNVDWYPEGTKKDTDIMSIKDNGEISLEDEGDLRSNRNWTLYIKGKLKNAAGSKNKTIFKKGNFEVVFYVTNNLVYIRISSSGASWSKRIHNYYKSPHSPSDLNYKETEISLVREGISFKLYINGEECFKSAQGDSPDPIFGIDKNLPIVFSGSIFKRLDKVYITEPSFVGFKVMDASGNYRGDVHSYLFTHDMDITNSYYQWNQYFPDKFGSFAKIFNVPKGVVPEKQKMWVVPPSLDTSNGYVAKDRCLSLGEYNHGEYVKLPYVDFRKDFTISCWVSFDDTNANFLIVEAEDGAKLKLRFYYKKTSAEGIKIFLGSKEKVFPVSGLGGGADVKWQHITIIKNGPLVGLATNGIFPTTWKYFTMTDDQQNSMKSGEVRFVNPNKTKNLYLSHIRILDYAVSHIPQGGIGGLKSNYDYFMNELLAPIEPGRTS